MFANTHKFIYINFKFLLVILFDKLHSSFKEEENAPNDDQGSL